MSATCSKQFSIVISSNCDTTANEYFKLDEAAGPWHGSINPLRTLHDDGAVPVTVIPGIISNGIRMTPGFPFMNSISGTWPANPCPAGSISVSFSFWVRPVASGTDPFDATFFDIFWRTPQLRVTISVTNLTITVTGGIGPSMTGTGLVFGVWNFIVVTVDKNSGIWTIWLNNAVNKTGLLGNFTANSSGIGGFLTVHDFNFSGVIDFDEIGYWLGTALNGSDVAQMWNGGAGARPPGV